MELRNEFTLRRDGYETAALLDPQAKKIAVAEKFGLEIARFTGAHELGHAVLHPGNVMRRDRPIEGLRWNDRSPRPQIEREADFFAGCFLMPRKPVISVFEENFEIKTPLVIDETTAFWLCPDEPDFLLRTLPGSSARALAVASCESFEGRHFDSLAKRFRVSVTSMAITLYELDLIRE